MASEVIQRGHGRPLADTYRVEGGTSVASHDARCCSVRVQGAPYLAFSHAPSHQRDERQNWWDDSCDHENRGDGYEERKGTGYSDRDRHERDRDEEVEAPIMSSGTSR